MPKYIFKHVLIALAISSLCSCASTSLPQPFNTPASTAPLPSDGLQLGDAGFWQGSSAMVWNRLTHTPLTKLELASTLDNATALGWIKLVTISKRDSTDSKELIQQLITWRSEFPSHPGNSLFPDNANLTSIQNTPPPQHIALLVPLQGASADSGQAIRDGFLNAYYASLSKTKVKQTISFYDTNTTTDMAALYQQAISEGATFVVGPLLKENVQTLAHSTSFSVPTLALNYSDNSLSNNFYEFGLSSADEANQAADKAASAGLSRAIIIAPQNDWGHHNSNTLVARWKSLGGSVSDSLYFTSQTNFNQDIPKLLHANTQNDHNKPSTERLRRQDFDVIFLLAQPDSARTIVPLLKYYYADNIPIYATSSVFSGTLNSANDQDLKGVIFCDIPWVLQANHPNRLFAVGQDAYLISSNLPRLLNLPNFPIYASTGALTMTSSHKIYRRLPWTRINAGSS